MQNVNYDESKVPIYTLPPLLKMEDGTEVFSAFDWIHRRRPDVLRVLQKEVYGAIPPRPSEFRKEVLSVKEDALDHTAIRKEIKLSFAENGKEHSFVMLLYIPKNTVEPVPVFVGLNFKGNHTTTTEKDVMKTGRDVKGELIFPDSYGEQVGRWQFEKTIEHGYASATACFHDISPDNPETDSWRKGIWNLFCSDESDEEFHKHGTAISAWAWGLSRMLDVLESEPLIDCRKAVVHGHSRLGKTSLWTGANDHRFRFVISNDSGCCGAAIHRRVFGETIRVITENFPHWFVSSLKNYVDREMELPFDQHWLVALSAPRPVCIASASEDLWADPKGEYLSGVHASEVWKLFGAAGMPEGEMPGPDEKTTGEISYHLRAGIHDQQLFDWAHYWDIADKYIR